LPGTAWRAPLAGWGSGCVSQKGKRYFVRRALVSKSELWAREIESRGSYNRECKEYVVFLKW
jgi:hypothetical protein